MFVSLLSLTGRRAGLHAGVAALLALVTFATLSAQDGRGRIGGRVLDPTGAPIPGATVEATEDSTRVKFSATSNDTGAYEILYLMPGMYKIAVSAGGFKA